MIMIIRIYDIAELLLIFSIFQQESAYTATRQCCAFTLTDCFVRLKNSGDSRRCGWVRNGITGIIPTINFLGLEWNP
jgi:hypothetical protein